MSQWFTNKRILVTGGASFIGSHLVDKLVNCGAHVRVADDFSSGSRENLSDSIGQIEVLEGDLRDYRVCEEATNSIEVVFHLANIHGGRGFIETHPAEISQNLIIDGNMLRAGFAQGIDRFCYTSSACVYPVNLQVADDEQKERYLFEEMADPFSLGGALADGEYGWAKLMGEMALSAYGKQMGMKGVSCRLFTVYGPRENESHAIIAFIAKALIRQDPYEIWGSGQQDRNFTYVSDVIEGLMLSAEGITDCSAINIGTDEIIKIADAARVVREIIGHKPDDLFYDTSKPTGVHGRSASTKRQVAMLNWKPKIAFEDGIKQTIEWYEQYADVPDLKVNLGLKLFER